MSLVMSTFGAGPKTAKRSEPAMPLSEDDVREILRLIDESDVEELRVETDALSLHVVRERAAAEPARRARRRRRHRLAGPDRRPRHDRRRRSLGTFYRAPAPGAAAVRGRRGARRAGARSSASIEVMKMMNPIPAGVAGTIVEICVENAQLVEYGAPLFRVEAGRMIGDRAAGSSTSSTRRRATATRACGARPG